MDLFSETNSPLDLPDADVEYFASFFTSAEADLYFSQLQNEIPWQQDQITIFGKTHPQPRLTALFGNGGKSYSYSNIQMQPHSWTPLLLEIKAAVEAVAKVTFTTVLLNYYRDGKDSNGWHADDEKELGQNPVIASVSFGAERAFHLRNNADKSLKQKILLQHGSLLIMKGKTQHFWKHQIPKTAKPIGARINLTFRIINS